MKLRGLTALLSSGLILAGCQQYMEIQEPQHDGLVISASCGVATRTDINEGHSTWEAGDAITVVYDGRNYEYTTAEGGDVAVFTSTAGIDSYDSAKPLVAYYPTTADGNVAVETERNIVFKADEQINSAKAPLVGVSTGVSSNVINLSFKNVFSVMELRVDAGELATKATSLTLEPASENFQGFMTFTGTVDPATLALTAAENGQGNTLTLKFEGGVDLTKPYTLKFPVGRFISPDGLKCTLTTEDGQTFSKNIYKTGVTTYTEKDGVFSSKHMAKALYAMGPAGGIRVADDLVAFAAAVNSGASIAEWQDEAGVVKLLDDIDMTGVNWTPIGNGTFVDQTTVNAPYFTGTFDGQGYTVDNLVINNEAVAPNGVAGLFGIVKDGTVRNVTLGEGCSYNVKGSTETSYCFVGGIAAVITGKSNVDACVNKAAIFANQPVIQQLAEGGIVGYVYAFDVEASITNCKNYGTLSSETASTNNGGKGLQLGGIVGSLQHPAEDGYFAVVRDCENYGTINAKSARAGGIAGLLNKGALVSGSNNYGEVNQSNVLANNRNGGIAGIMQGTSKIENCTNYGNVTFIVADNTTHGYVGGIVGQTGGDGDVIDGCVNYGTLRSDIIKGAANAKFITAIAANTNNKKCTIRNCKAGGKIGPYTEDDTYKLFDITSENFSNYIWFDNKMDGAKDPKLENNAYAGVYVPESSAGINTVEDLLAFRDAVNAGTELTQWQDDNGVINLWNDLDMSAVTDWTPIGNGVFTGAVSSSATSSYTGAAFKGVFNGNDHVIKNLKMKKDLTGAGAVYGFFGILDGATVKNLVMGAPSGDAGVLEVSGNGMTDTGVVAAVSYCATVENCVNYIPVKCKGLTAGAVRMTSGMVGFVYGVEGSVSTLSKLTNHAAVVAEAGTNTGNGASGVQVGAIAGVVNSFATSELSTISDCVNNGDMTSSCGRCSGILATANRGAHIVRCTNNGNQVNTAANARIGNVASLLSANCKMTDCVNNGDLVVTDSKTHLGGLVALMNGDNSELTGGGNYGDIIGDLEGYHGTLVANINKPGKMDNVIAGGGYGKYNGGSYEMVTITADNYMSYIGKIASDYASKVTNIIWEGAIVSHTFSVTPATATINVLGTNAITASLSSVASDWTVTCDSWLHVADASGNPVAEGTKSDNVQNLKITADRNEAESPRTGTVTFASKVDPSVTAVVAVTQDPFVDAFPSKWVFSTSNAPLYSNSWTNYGMLPSTTGTSAYITAGRGEKYAATPLKFTFYSDNPTITTPGEGDYLLYVLPVKHVDAGSAIEFNATLGGGTGAPKYYIVEYFEDGRWKAVEEDLRTAAEDPSIKYTYMSSGALDPYQYTTVMQTIRLGKAIDNGELKIRCRAVGTMTASGTAQDISKTGRVLLPKFGFTGSYVQNMGTAEPKDTKTVLCLGNSFSYYSNPIWMLKEIAYSQGHYLKIKAHVKGSQHLTNHTTLSMSLEAINQGGYDYAFIQDQSQNPANYAKNGTASIMQGCTDLVNIIKTASPSCQMILEETWAFPSSTYGGFDSYENFDALLEQGTKSMAQANSAWMSPIGKAFKAARANTSFSLYHTDNKHQSEYGAYLKACVNYLVLFGEAFTGTVPNCGLDADKAAYLRQIAEQTVLGKEAENLIVRN